MRLLKTIRTLTAVLLVSLPAFVFAGDIARFEGTYEGQAEVIYEGETQRRDMSATIEETRSGFELSWTSIIHRNDGRISEKTYSIDFVSSLRENIYTSAMKTNVFGKRVPLDPLKGEPFVWARLEGDTLSVFSMFIDAEGEYEIQEYHRTLVDGGLDLYFLRVHTGEPNEEIRAFLAKE